MGYINRPVSQVYVGVILTPADEEFRFSLGRSVGAKPFNVWGRLAHSNLLREAKI